MSSPSDPLPASLPARDDSPSSVFAPLREPVFRRIWIASLFSNFGQLILGVGAAWEMTRLSSSPSMVALVQTASLLPLMLVALPAGAMADMYDKRKLALFGLGAVMLSGAVLTSLAYHNFLTPLILLACCFMIGTGFAIYVPAWQSSVGEQVPSARLPSAIALGSVSYNLARSFGPAVGGLIVLALGARAAFAINVMFCLPLWFMYFLWRRQHVTSRLPPERMDRAIISGMRYARHSVPIRSVLARAAGFGFASSTIYALMPLVAKDILGGNAGDFGILLGAMGVGAIIGALFVGRLRGRFSNEAIFRGCTLAAAATLPVIGISTSLILTCIAIAIFGFCNMNGLATLNVSVQLSAPRWVTARALSLYSSALTGGMASGAWIWGLVAARWTVSEAFIASGAAVGVTLLLAPLIPLPRKEREEDVELAQLGNMPRVALDLTLRSGPVVIEVEYDVDPEQAREFHEVMTRMGKMRKRIGAFDWTISRDIANPAIWIEHYHCPTWGDYLRMRDRYSQADTALQDMANGFNRTGEAGMVRRRLERPYGSVRWKADSHDPKFDSVGYL
jgi:predicted MFS family arabinose efflux permease